MPAPGTRLGRFEILELLGAGGMGEVYRARDLRLGREVALKLLPEQFVRDAQRLARFERETQVLASLNQPNIAALHEIVVLEDGVVAARGRHEQLVDESPVYAEIWRHGLIERTFVSLDEDVPAEALS